MAGGLVKRTGVAVLGSTGSIGANTLDVIARHPDRFRVVALAANRNAARLAEQCLRFAPEVAAMADPAAAQELEERLAAARREARSGRSQSGSGDGSATTRILAGADGLEVIASLPQVDCVMAAVVGAAGLNSTLAAARAGKRLLLANKESLVMAGPLLLAEVRASGGELLPIDSEHNAIFQCLPHDARPGSAPAGVRRVVLTASGGPFLDWPPEAIAAATPDQACAHPNWVMGRKISVDSATLMNKGLELIEACFLFGLPPERVDILVHRQSIVHSLVEYVDGSVLAHLAAPDMRTPIAHALAWPDRVEAGVQFLDLVQTARLDFRAPDTEKFRCLALAQAAARAGGLHPVVLNAANEVAVHAFLEGRLNFPDIAAVIDSVIVRTSRGEIGSLDDVLQADAEARSLAREGCERRREGRAGGARMMPRPPGVRPAPAPIADQATHGLAGNGDSAHE
ncbi:MAG TPA: 1-deoxy-D-xylulose-5-phosphate reductoisomerase [Steroidobacteraceae bacterium]|nr:1-deoxy-D-xylulose-5-phosphate reductoisomerase [Steroidobacteraceae bacterium]